MEALGALEPSDDADPDGVADGAELPGAAGPVPLGSLDVGPAEPELAGSVLPADPLGVAPDEPGVVLGAAGELASLPMMSRICCS